MASATSADTARAWARERALDVWIVDGRGRSDTLAHGLEQARRDGAVVVELPERELATLPAPYPLFTAMRTAGATDVRRVGLVSGDCCALVAGRRAGLGAVVGLRGNGREPLTAAEPDAVIAAEEFAAFDAERFGSARAHRPRVLLNPGPALTSERVKRAAAGLDLCHREPEHALLRQRIEAKLRASLGLSDGWRLVLLAGSGTAAMEAMVAAAVRPGRRLLVCRNGVYGERLADMAARLRIPHETLERPWTSPIDPDEVEERLAAEPALDAVALVHHETTTGLLNPVAEIAARARAQGRLVALDAISSLGGERLSLEGTAIGLVACTANKCLHGLPGVSFVLLSPAGVERAFAAEPRSVYLDLRSYLVAADSGSVPFTPAIPATYALEAALDELLEEGPDSRHRRYRERVALLDRRLDAIGLEQLLPARVRSSSIRTVRLPAGVSYARLHERLRAAGYVIYAGQGPLAASVFRIATLGNLELAALEGFCDELATALAGPDAG